MVSKSTAEFLKNTSLGYTSGATALSANLSTASSQAQTVVLSDIQKMLSSDYIRSFVESGQGYAEWAATAKDFRIADLSEALEEVGYTENKVRELFQQQASILATERNSERIRKEDEFWSASTTYALRNVDQREDIVYEQQNTRDVFIRYWDRTNELLVSIQLTTLTFLQEWSKYFVESKVYRESYSLEQAGYLHWSNQMEKPVSAIENLAEALTKANLDDPRVQTNALLSQIVLLMSTLVRKSELSPLLEQKEEAFPNTYSGLVLMT